MGHNLTCITACAVATSCCISDEPCQWEKANFDPTAPTFVDQSPWNSNLRNMSGRPPNMPNFVKIGLRGWAGRTPSLPQFWFYPLFFFFFCLCIHRIASWPYRWTDYDARWLIGRVFRQGSAFWGWEKLISKFNWFIRKNRKIYNGAYGEIKKKFKLSLLRLYAR